MKEKWKKARLHRGSHQIMKQSWQFLPAQWVVMVQRLAVRGVMHFVDMVKLLYYCLSPSSLPWDQPKKSMPLSWNLRWMLMEPTAKDHQLAILYSCMANDFLKEVVSERCFQCLPQWGSCNTGSGAQMTCLGQGYNFVVCIVRASAIECHQITVYMRNFLGKKSEEWDEDSIWDRYWGDSNI